MHGRIELLGSYYDVTVLGPIDGQMSQIDNCPPQRAMLKVRDSGDCEIKLGEQCATVRMFIKGETAYIRAFGQTFSLRVVNPVEQARMETGGSSRIAKAPMPGVVVDIHAAEGESIKKGQLIMTIESMKILTTIPAPSEGRIQTIHFSAGQPFEKGAVLVTMSPEAQ
jgi:3-methylcrotonyl-CoA carboxylase alpha subunit